MHNRRNFTCSVHRTTEPPSLFERRVSHMPEPNDYKRSNNEKIVVFVAIIIFIYVMIGRSKTYSNFFVTNLIFFSVFEIIESRRTVNQFVNYTCM